MADVRRYTVVRRRTKTGQVRYAVLGDCVVCDLREAGRCGHPPTLMPWRWATRGEAERWVIAVQKRQADLAKAMSMTLSTTGSLVKGR